jgi:hypothetical protein
MLPPVLEQTLANSAVVNFIAGGLFEVTRKDPSRSASIAPGAVAMLFLFVSDPQSEARTRLTFQNLIYAATYGTSKLAPYPLASSI